MSDLSLNARTHIPKEWLSGAVCPVCGEKNLMINQLLNQADCMMCASCASSFEIAQDGDHIRLVDGPANLPQQALGNWLKPATLRGLIQKNRIVDTPQIPQNTLPVDLDSLRSRAQELQRLGNDPAKIQATLSRLPGINPNDLQRVIEEIQAERARKQQKTLQTTMIVITLFVLSICSLFVLMGPTRSVLASALMRTGIIKATPTSEQTLAQSLPQTEQNQKYLDKSRLPSPLQTLIPAGANIIEPPDVIVRAEKQTGKKHKCPFSPGEAVLLFGGQLDAWSKANFGWTMISTDPQTIHVPEGMYAGYLVFIEKPEFLNVVGPATIENVNFLSISCE